MGQTDTMHRTVLFPHVILQCWLTKHMTHRHHGVEVVVVVIVEFGLLFLKLSLLDIDI